MSTKKARTKAMIDNFQELVSEIKETETFDKEVARDEVSDFIDLLMKKEGIKKAELARRLGKSRAYVTKILQGNANFTLDTLVQIARALGYKFAPMFIPKEMEWKPDEVFRFSVKAKGIAPKETLDNDYQVPIQVNTEDDEEQRDKDAVIG
jgi:transcriptional regulator with XRE-family HTH domain